MYAGMSGHRRGVGLSDSANLTGEVQTRLNSNNNFQTRLHRANSAPNLNGVGSITEPSSCSPESGCWATKATGIPTDRTLSHLAGLNYPVTSLLYTPFRRNSLTNSQIIASPHNNRCFLLDIPLELRCIIYSHLLPSIERTINLTSSKQKGPTLLDCFDAIYTTCKQIMEEIECWYAAVEDKYGFDDSPHFGLVNPQFTTFIIDIDQTEWNKCDICSCEHDTRCRNCPKSHLIATRRLNSMELGLIHHIKINLNGQDPEDLPTIQLLEQGNFTALQLLKILGEVRSVEVSIGWKDLKLTWDEFWGSPEVLAFSEAPLVPINFCEFCCPETGAVLRPSFKLWDSWAHNVARRELNCDLPQKQIRYWPREIKKAGVGKGKL